MGGLFQNTGAQLLSHCTLLTSAPQRQNLRAFPESSRLPKDAEARQSSTSTNDQGSCQSVGPQHWFSIDILLVCARLLGKALLTTLVIACKLQHQKSLAQFPKQEESNHALTRHASSDS